MRIVQFYYKCDTATLNDKELQCNYIKVGIQLDDEFGDVIDLEGYKDKCSCSIKSCIDLIICWENDISFREFLYR